MNSCGTSGPGTQICPLCHINTNRKLMEGSTPSQIHLLIKDISFVTRGHPPDAPSIKAAPLKLMRRALLRPGTPEPFSTLRPALLVPQNSGKSLRKGNALSQRNTSLSDWFSTKETSLACAALIEDPSVPSHLPAPRVQDHTPSLQPGPKPGRQFGGRFRPSGPLVVSGSRAGARRRPAGSRC